MLSRYAVLHSCALLLLALMTPSALALDPTQPTTNYIRRTFTVDDGLPDNVVNAILQSRDGFLWIGTGSGLVRLMDGGSRRLILAFRAPSRSRCGRSPGGRMEVCGWEQISVSCASPTWSITIRADRHLRSITRAPREMRGLRFLSSPVTVFCWRALRGGSIA